MKEHPKIFSAPMMRAIREGRKTQTRRLMKVPKWAEPGTIEEDEDGLVAICRDTGCLAPIKTPASPGDLIWCRETWIEGFPTGEPGRWSSIRPTGFEGHGRAFYRADDDDPPDEPRRNWRSSMFMPRWASRETLRVLSVRPERVQDITEADARAEGVKPFPLDPEGDCWTDGTHRTAFNFLWNEINGWDPNSWCENPWVWRYEFERVK